MTLFDLFLLDTSKGNGVIALGRRGSDTAIEQLPVDGEVTRLATFGRLLGQAISGNAERPSANDLDAFGRALFSYLFRGELKTLYDRLPVGPVSIQILSDRADIKEVPWEYLITPNCQPTPHRDRSVIRVQPTCGVDRPEPRKISNTKIRVLFVSADPVDQAGVDWMQLEAVLKRTLVGQMPDEASIKLVEGATRQTLIDAINRETFDVFHFFGHGDLKNGIGHLVLEDLSTGKSDYLSGSDLAIALAGKGVQLAILSACLSGAGKHDDDFAVIATALIKAGIPAVVANQYPIPIKSIAPFVGSVYTSLMLDGNIDRAVADGRVALKVLISGTTGAAAVVEWGIPTLYRLWDASQLFRQTP